MRILACLMGAALASAAWCSDLASEYDIVIYGSSPAAISAAVQAKRMSKKAVIVSPETRIGGLTTGGLGQTDIGNKSAFGGIALEFYRAVADYYRDETNWKYQKRSDYLPDGQCAGTKGADSMWTFEPSAALKILEGWEQKNELDIRRGEYLVRESKSGVEVEGGRIKSIRTLSGKVYRGKMFVDATYEGDLMAAAGVSYTVGREANSVYGETISGNAPDAEGAWNHNINDGVSAYVKPGDRSSGLLPGVEPYDPNEKVGDGDRRVQAYCFRMCLTDAPENRIPFVKPANYDEKDYELLFRDYEAAWKHPEKRPVGARVWLGGAIPSIMSRMPNRKTDSNNRCGFSTDFIGRNWAWPEASYAERERILKAHLDYQRGLMWTLANHPRIPQEVRDCFSQFGTCKDEFPDGLGDGWQRQLYVREARRLVGDYVMTEHNCRGKAVAARPVAMGAYTMDSHHVRRMETKDGFVRNEGNVEDHRFGGPYGIDYGAIVPKRGECANLFVPVCLSASHMAFGSIRMEPVFFALGQVAGTAAAQAIDADCAVQDLAYGPLAARLILDGQVLTLEDPPTTVVIAAANSRAFEKKAADFVCTGVHDERVINAAIVRLTRGGTVRLADGDYFVDAFENPGNSAVFFGYNGGSARVVALEGTTENKGYNTRHGVTIHVTKAAMDDMDPDKTYRVFYGCERKPPRVGDFYTYTHLNNVNFRNFFLYFENASRRLIGIDGRAFGSMELDLVGIYQKSYFNDRFMHVGAPDIPCDGTVGVYSVPGSNDEMARSRYNEVNVGGLYRGFVMDEVDHLVMTGCCAARCVYGYWFEKGTPKTTTVINCCDEGNTYLPRFRGRGHVTMIDFNVERFNARFIPTDCRGENAEHGAVEEVSGGWKGSVEYTIQGAAYGLGTGGGFAPGRFWASGSGSAVRTRNLDE